MLLPILATTNAIEGVTKSLNIASLAGPFLVSCSSAPSSPPMRKQYTWSLIPIDSVSSIHRTIVSTPGGQAWSALNQLEAQCDNPVLRLQATLDLSERLCSILMTGEGSSDTLAVDANLIAVLARVMCQWAIAMHLKDDTSGSNSFWTIHCPGESDPIRIPTLGFVGDLDTSRLYESFPDAQGEIVEMVDQRGRPMGHVPRKLVHKFNMLHRGIGIFVAKDKPIQKNAVSRPDLYVHRRTDTKRIFPSLYDMFVGGVSLAGEDSIVTARREVEEELGLTRGTEAIAPEPLLQCVVCTAYNRCVVDLFAYCMDTTNEEIRWQQEEVAWGSFVSYHVVEAAADRSILRLGERAEWPGRSPPIQSSRHGDADDPVRKEAVPWREWDFVPDGLLVWEAWLRESEKDSGS
jgi:isopentenyldiphosphate isomerase